MAISAKSEPTLNVTSPAHQMNGEIQSLMDHLGERLGCMNDTVSALEKRLEPVLNDQMDAGCEEGSAASPCCSPLSRAIDNDIRSLVAIEKRLHKILDMLLM